MVDQVRLSQALSAALAAGGSGAAMAVCRAAVAWLPMTGAAITVMSELDGAQQPVCATDAAAVRIDELQFSLGDGPCVESFSTGRAVLVSDIGDPAEGRWPAFAAAAAQTGARGMFVFPLRVGAAILGVLDCYRDTPGALDDRDLTGALRAADAAVWTLLGELDKGTIVDGHPGPEWFDTAALFRAEVHQATGILTAQAGISVPDALARLRATAYATDRPISEVAADVLARRLRLDSDGVWQTHHPPSTEHTSTEHTSTSDTNSTDSPGGQEPGREHRLDLEPEEGENP